MPEGIIATDNDDGFVVLDFVDPALRGPALAELLEIGGPGTIETISRRGPRRQYRVPKGNATTAGLLDELTDVIESPPRSAGADTGRAAALKAADPNVNAGGGEDWHTPVAEYTSANAYVGQVPNADVLHGRPQVHTGDAASYGGRKAPENETHRELIDRVKEGSSVLAVGGVQPATEVEPRGLIPVSHINAGLADHPGARGDDPGARPDAGGEALGDYTTVQSTRLESPQTGQTTATIEGDRERVQTEASPGTAEEPTKPDTEDVVEYPEGEPTKEWRRDELDAYALKVKGLDTSALGNKTEVLDAISKA
ncbi:hypothetical protein SEA_ZENTENO07_19 [Mycobacterium phage Zenteno07]|nr:hypothetical protein SEA_ZENTENO07_19 [Mycobacterium phage Zenteno07]